MAGVVQSQAVQKMNFVHLVICSLLVTFLLDVAECVVSIREVSPVNIGQNVVIYCDLFNEPLQGLIWRRYTNYNQSLVVNLLSSNLPDRYTINNSVISPAYSVSSLFIANVQPIDLSTYECSSNTLDRVNLTRSSGVDPLTLCLNGSYNSGLYVMLIISSFILAGLMFGFYKLLPSSKINLNFGVIIFCSLGSAVLTIILVIFWSSPTYIATYPSNIYWSPVVIVPLFMVSYTFIWFAILFITYRAHVVDKMISLTPIIIISSVALCHYFFLFMILCSVAYCTGQSTLSPIGVDYSILSDIASAFILTITFGFLVYFFWVFKEQMASVGVDDIHKSKSRQLAVYSDMSKSYKEQTISELVDKQQSGGRLAPVESINNNEDPIRKTGARDFLTDQSTDQQQAGTQSGAIRAPLSQISHLISSFSLFKSKKDETEVGVAGSGGDDKSKKKKKSKKVGDVLVDEANSQSVGVSLENGVTRTIKRLKKMKKTVVQEPISASLSSANEAGTAAQAAVAATSDGDVEKQKKKIKKVKSKEQSDVEKI